MDRARSGEIPGTLCIACARNLVEARFKVCAADATLRETQTEKYEYVTPEPVEDITDT